MHESNTIVKFADDTTVVRLVSNNDETAYREEIGHLVDWCANNNLALNTMKTKEIIIYLRRNESDIPVLTNGG